MDAMGKPARPVAPVAARGGGVRLGRALACALVGALATATCARGAVRVEDGEVVFTLRAPHARTVHLVGSFNAWNATVEPMTREGDVFRVSLFLVEGTWHYRFVVDGRWIDDPDNPAVEGEPGSRLVLVERDGEIERVASNPPAGRTTRAWHPVVRLRAEVSGARRPVLDADAQARVRSEGLGARVTVRSRASAWTDGAPRDAWIEHARVVVGSGALRFGAALADSVGLDAGDPGAAAGEGRFGYAPGLSRRGVVLALGPAGGLSARLRWDAPAHTGDAAASIGGVGDRPREEGAVAAGVLRPLGGVADGDRLAGDVAVHVARLRAAWSVRARRAAVPGVLDMAAAPDSVVRRRSRERHRAWSVRVRLDGLHGLRSLVVDAGAGALWLDAVDAAAVVGDSLGGAGVVGTPPHEPVFGRPVDAPDVHARFATARRLRLEVGPREGGRVWRVAWTRMRFDFADVAGVSRAGAARVDRVRARWGVRTEEGTADVRARWTRIDAGAAPDAFHPDAPVRNPWAGLRDALDVADVVALDARTVTDASLRVRWQPTGLDTLGVDVGGVVARGTLAHAWAHAGATRSVRGAWTVFVDGRLVRYDRDDGRRPLWLAAGYVELAFRRAPLEVSVGWGFDPVQWDPVVDAWTSTARERFLREALVGSFGRSLAGELRGRWIERERRLRDASRVRVEAVVRF